MANAIYRWFLRQLRIPHTITWYFQQVEPLVWLIAALAAGLWIGRAGGPYGLLHLLAAFALGVLIGHIFWGGRAPR